MDILFLNGWQSTPGGLKPTYLTGHGHTVINPKLPADDFHAAVRIAQTEFDQHHPDVVVGSSRGGAVAMSMSMPALRLGCFYVWCLNNWSETAGCGPKYLSRSAPITGWPILGHWRQC